MKRMLLAAALALAAIGGAATWRLRQLPPPVPPPDLVLIVNVDTLTYDRLGVYGDARRLTPALDALGTEGLVFTAAFAASNHTRPSVASLMTGVRPGVHGYWVGKAPEDLPKRRNMADLFRELGYRTAWVNANDHVGSYLGGYKRSFDVQWWGSPPAGSADYRKGYYRAGFMRKKALEIVESLGTPDRLFLYVHLADPHSPYLPARYDADLFAGDPIGPNMKPELVEFRLSPALDRMTPEDLANGRNRYDAEIRLMDEELGTLLAEMRAKYPRALILVTSDHGESFMEHGVVSHGTSLYNIQVRVPFIVRDTTGRLVQRQQVASVVSQLDLLPFFAEYFGRPDLGGSGDGESFLNEIDGRQSIWHRRFGRREARRAVIESIYGLDHVYDEGAADVVRYGRPFRVDESVYVQSVVYQDARRAWQAPRPWKSISGVGPPEVMTSIRMLVPHYRELYDLAVDPGERTNVFDQRRDIGRVVARIAPPSPTGYAGLEDRPLTSEELERMRSLGYLGRSKTAK